MSQDKRFVTGKIDGKEVKVREGTSILEAAKSLGIMIPHFCYHPSIGVEGSCRMCLVEVKGRPKLEASCAVCLTEGMEVSTDTEEVKKARKGVLESLLINHPLDCPICDKGGECPLQDYSHDYGTGQSRFEEAKRHLPKHKILSDHIIFDSERCILCTRCVRYYRDIVGTHELVVAGRGHKAKITAFREKPLSNLFSGNIADFCPVGALTTRDFRFKDRPWEMKAYDTSCGICGLACSVQAWRKMRFFDKRIERLTPEFDPEVNDWWMCDKGRFTYKDLLSDNRIKAPLLKEEDSSRNLSFFDAAHELSEILEDLLKKNGRESMKIISSVNITNEEAWMLRLMSETFDKAGSVIFDMPAYVHDFMMYIKEKGFAAKGFKDIEDSDCLLFLGTEVVETHPVLYLRLRKLALGKRIPIYGTQDLKFPDESLIKARIGRNGFAGEELLSEIKKTLDNDGKLGKISLFVDEEWIKRSAEELKRWLLDLKDHGAVRSVTLLRADDFNTQGIVDISGGRFGFSEDIHSVMTGQVKELILIGDEVIRKVITDPKFKPEDYAFICMIKKFADGYSKYAHLVFPQRSFLEKNGTVTNVLGTVQRLTKSLRMTDEPVEEWRVLASLSNILGFKADFAGEVDVYGAVSKETGYKKDALVKKPEPYTHYDRELRG